MLILALLLALTLTPMAVAQGQAACRVAIDPGHGGSDPGAMRDGVRESDVVWDISSRVASILRAKGCTVILTRASSTNPSWGQRWQAAYSINAQVMVSIHTNSSSHQNSTAVYGSEAWWQGSHSRSKDIAKLLTDTVSARAGIRNRGVKVGKAPYSSAMPSALIELAFINNPNERALLTSRPDMFAQAVADAITTFLNMPTQRIHVVQRGETLYAIAQKYKVTVDALVRVNNIQNRSLIFPGQRLIIP